MFGMTWKQQKKLTYVVLNSLKISCFQSNEHISKIIFNKLSGSTPLSSLLPSPPLPSLQHIHPSTLPFPPLTIIIEVHLSEDLIRPLLRRGFILWHLHHR